MFILILTFRFTESEVSVQAWPQCDVTLNFQCNETENWTLSAGDKDEDHFIPWDFLFQSHSSGSRGPNTPPFGGQDSKVHKIAFLSRYTQVLRPLMLVSLCLRRTTQSNVRKCWMVWFAAEWNSTPKSDIFTCNLLILSYATLWHCHM